MSANPHLEVRLRLPLDRFELDVEFHSEARVTAVLGPSGSSKSSLLESIAGLRPAARGEVRWGEAHWLASKAARPSPPEARQIGYVPQEGLLFPRRSVRENLRAGRRRALARGVDFETIQESTLELLELAPLLEQSVQTLSGGERQRVALARALCSGPRFLLLDEPLSSLDLPLRRRLLPYLRRVAQDFGLPVLLVTHDPIEVQALAEHLIVLDEGRVLASGEPRQVLARPEVLRLAAGDAFENILPARVSSRQANSSELLLGDGPGAPLLIAPSTERLPGENLLVGISAEDIILATTRPQNISARNILRSTILSVEALEEKRLVRAELHPGLPPVCVEVTAMTAQELSLIPGREVFLLIKTVACQLYDSVALPDPSAPA